MRLAGRKIFSPMNENIKDNEIIYLESWLVVPMKLIHNAECYGFMVTSRIENKTIAYITDTTYIPKGLPIKQLDCLMLEVNYDKEIANMVSLEKELSNNGYLNHLSLDYVNDYCYSRLKENEKIKRLVVCHTSNSDLLDNKKVLQVLNKYANEICFAKKGLELNI